MSHSPGLPRDWIPTLERFLEREPTVARIVVTEARGSTPREPGAFMLVGQGGVEGSIGGGRLELEAIVAARALLADPSVAARVSKVVLAADVGQCCGGVVSFWLDKFSRDDVSLLRAAADAGARGAAVLVSEVTADGMRRRLIGLQDEATPVDRLLHEPRQYAKPVVVASGSGELTFTERLDDIFPSVWLYGAGHVGQALARILAELPLRLTWIDSRTDLFPNPLPDGVRVLQDADSVATVFEAPVGAYFVVMSHSHPLDFELCHALLERNDFAWLGLIGSDSKAARFRSRLARAGLGADVIAKLVCPIGVEGITSKWPAAIAVAVAAELMQKISAAAAHAQSEAMPSKPMPPKAMPPMALPPKALPPKAMPPMAMPPTATPDPLNAPCVPERCSTCGSVAEASHTDSTPNTASSPRPDTVTP